MATPYYGEMQIIGFNFAPVDWADCDGQILNVNDHLALFSLISNKYGGDGRATFALPDMRGRVPIGFGEFYSARYDVSVLYPIGQPGGASDVTLSPSELPAHTHRVLATEDFANKPANRFGGAQLAVGSSSSSSGVAENAYAPAANLVSLDSAMVSSFGGGASHTNVQPTLTLRFIIALEGIYPQRP